MATTLHVGTTALGLHALTRAAHALRLPRSVVDGDGWECWGEPVGTDVNDPVTLHVTFTADEILPETVLALEKAITLPRMTTGAQAGVFASLSDSDDWSLNEVIFSDAPTPPQEWFDPLASTKDDWDLFPPLTAAEVERTTKPPCLTCGGGMTFQACPNLKTTCTDCCGEEEHR